MTTLIEQLAAAKGIASEYVDAWGHPAQVSEESKAAMLGAMGYRVDDEAALTEQLEQEHRQHWLRALDPVMVVRSGEPITPKSVCPSNSSTTPLSWQPAGAGGGVVRSAHPIDGELVGGRIRRDGVPGLSRGLECTARAGLSRSDPAGGGQRRAARQHAPHRRAQVVLQAAPIATAARCGARACSSTACAAATTGASAISAIWASWSRRWPPGVLTSSVSTRFMPHPANPESASPYSPSSRRWLNVAYIDVEAVPEFLANARLKAEVANPAFQQHLSELRAKGNVDYTGVIETKLGMLRQVFDQACLSAERQAAFDAFVAAGGDSLQQQAAFDALQAHFYGKGENAWGGGVAGAVP